MEPLASKFKRLKMLVGGNREKFQYEETFGKPVEEMLYITPPGAWNRRILAELEFGIQLSLYHNKRYDSLLENVLDSLLNKMKGEGVLTNSACSVAEKMLLPMEQDAKEFSLILAAHAHIDMNWMWGWDETVAATIATFRTMLRLMDEYPSFCFSQSQASVYQIVEEYAPELKPEIMKRIEEGRWEVTASAWVETDKNMPSAQALLNHIHYTRKYLREHWNIAPETLDLDFSPDTFGHSRNIPDLNSLGGVKYYYHCRGLDGDHALYRWRAPSGEEVLVLREQYWYNAGITPVPAMSLPDVSRRCGGLQTGLLIYGVGDHGGGPTRRDLERALEMMEWPVFPKLEFGTMHDFFHCAEAVRDKLPVVDRELNCIFPGCYTTQSRIKMANRRVESALGNAQFWNALASRETKAPYAEEQYERGWQNLLFTHFHDILTGSCVRDSREHAMGLYANAKAVADTRRTFSWQAITAEIDTVSLLPEGIDVGSQAEGAGAGFGLESLQGFPSPEQGGGLTRLYHVFNSLVVPRTGCCELTVWDWPGDLRLLQLKNERGEPLTVQLIDKIPKRYWSHQYFRLLVQVSVPAGGYTSIILTQGVQREYPYYLQPEKRSHLPKKNIILENRYLRAEFDYKTGEMISLSDKAEGVEKIRAGESAGLRYVTTEHKTSNAWEIGRYISMERVDNTTELSPSEGKLRCGFQMTQEFQHSSVKAEVFLEPDSNYLTLRYDIDWHEVSRKDESVPLLIYKLPLSQSGRYTYDVPGGVLSRDDMEMDVPGLRYASVCRDGRCVFLASDSKYGYRGQENNLICSLIHAAKSPDPYPERGIHTIALAVGVEADSASALDTAVSSFCVPLQYQSGTRHPGFLPASSSFLEVESDSAVLNGVSRDKEHTILQICETEGKDTEISIHLRTPATEAQLTDLSGHPIEGQVSRSGSQLIFRLKAYRTCLLRFR